MHVGRSLLISLSLCIIFFVLLRPESPTSPPPPPSADTLPVMLPDSFAIADSLADSAR